jgi:Zn-dependent protease with chaperone function
MEEPTAPPSRSSAARTLLLYRGAVTVVALWALFATTLLVWFLAQGGVVGLLALLRRPQDLLSARAASSWELGALGALAAFVVAFVLCQAVGRGLLRLLAPEPLAWPERLPRPEVPVRLLAFRSSRPDAFTFTLLVPSGHLRWRREEVILVSRTLLEALDRTEWEAVVAHELGHVREYDGRYLTFLRTFARQMRWDPILASVAARLTRREEFLADDEAVELTGRPLALARAIFKASTLAPASRGALVGLLGPGGAAGRRQAVERIRRLVALAEAGRFEGEGA